jgi:2-keto-4-pentenoate hydratase
MSATGRRPLDHDAEAERIVAARDDRRTLDPISSYAAITMDDAYAIQSLLTARRLARGEHRVGWKLGYTSQAMREQMGVAEANFGPLTDTMLLADGADIGSRFTQPRVEPEVALRFARRVGDHVDRGAVLAAVGSAHAALEVVDSVWTDYRFRIEDNTADGSSAAGVVLGPEIPVGSIAGVGVTLLLDGEPVGHGRGSDAGGHPADGVVWLIERLRAEGADLMPGEIVITGGLTAAAWLQAGSRIVADFDVGAAVSVRRT